MKKIDSKIVILGLGNILLSDEGIGIKVIYDLKNNYVFPKNVEIIDGGVGGFSLLPLIEKAEKLLVIDAVLGNNLPGTIYKFKDKDILYQIIEKISLHEINFCEILNLAKLRKKYPEEVVIIGIEPEKIETSLELSETLKAKYSEFFKAILLQLEEWGIRPVPKKDHHHLEAPFFVEKP